MLLVIFTALKGEMAWRNSPDPEWYGMGVGKVLLDKAQELHGDLEVEVFKENLIARRFYLTYGFELLEAKQYEITGQQVLRVKFTAGKWNY